MQPVGISMRTLDILDSKTIQGEEGLDYGGGHLVDQAPHHLLRAGEEKLFPQDGLNREHD